MNDTLHPVFARALAPFMPAVKPDEYYLPGDADEGCGWAHQQQQEQQQQLEQQQNDGRDD